MPLEPGDGNIRCMTFDRYYIYAGTDAEPGKIVQLQRDDLVHVGTLTLERGENSLMSMIIDSSAIFVGTVTSPGRVVKIQKPSPPPSADKTLYTLSFKLELFNQDISKFSGKQENWLQTGVAAAVDAAFGDVSISNPRKASDPDSMLIDMAVRVEQERDEKEVESRLRSPDFSKRAAKFMHHFTPGVHIPTIKMVGPPKISPPRRGKHDHHLYGIFGALFVFILVMLLLGSRRGATTDGYGHLKVDDEEDGDYGVMDGDYDGGKSSGTPS